MHKTMKLGGVIAISMILAGGLTGCGGGMFSRDKAPTDSEVLLGQDGRTLWESGLQYVKIVNQDVVGSLKNEHPESISSDELRTVLGSIYVSETSFFKREDNVLFSRAELHVLSTAIANGLSQAQDNEDINFVSIGQHKGVLAKERKTTTGRVFISDGRLNIVFGLIHEIYRDKDIATGQKIDRRIHPLNPGTRRFDAKPKVRVALDSGQANYLDPETGNERTDWLVIDIATVLAAAKERVTGDSSSVTPELLEDIARSKQDSTVLRRDVGKLKEIIFDMSDEIEKLKQQIENTKN
ncbi:MAG: hypothetical protein COA90_10925 [Gammaproteobacteria bacterium]|nr:MAG: hypothetical protein COA90_10925 [Gammaproteobacteria bacterium]